MDHVDNDVDTRGRRQGLVLPEDTSDRDTSLLSNPIRLGFWLITLSSLAVRFAVLKDGYFLTDDFMMSTRATEQPLSLEYLTRVHTGHLEPVGFGAMWLLTHLDPLNWPLAVAALIGSQLILFVMVWRLLCELFGRRALVLLPFGYYAFSVLTVPAFTWLAGAILWIPLGIATAGLLRQQTRYLRTLDTRHLLGSFAWLLFAMACFEKVLVVVPFLVAFAFVVVPDLRLRWGVVVQFLRQTWPLWLGYAVMTVAYFVYYTRGAAASDTDSSVRSPSVGELVDFAYKTVLQAFVPSALGGPLEWTPVSPATGIVSSPAAFDWAMWVLAAALVVVALCTRRRIGRAFAALGVYLLFSILALAVSRVPLVGAVAGLETRYVADAVIPLTVVLGMCIMPLVGERSAWLGMARNMSRETLRAVRIGGAVLAALVLVMSLRAMGAYTAIHIANPHRQFVETAKASIQSLPESAQVFDGGVPVDVIGPLFLEYNETSRFLAPFASAERRRQMYTTTYYKNPVILDKSGHLVKMRVDGVSSPQPLPGVCGWIADKGEVEIPLDGDVFAFGWAVRIGYLVDGPTNARVEFGNGARDIALEKGLGEVYFRINGGGRSLRLTGLDPNVNVCIGQVTVGNAVPSQGGL